ncbi:hypothetical protein COR50_17725 [Chitinophaga caeni]|uniref:Uncharacterized protein n=1 Tax=Chitinophaga caeni TaxID=2029983 RepID=A0A291QY34_9BACT|nr:hypothetical protein COR50_17725 [Chitinophaga caeni]
MFICSFLVLFCLPKKGQKRAKIGHYGPLDLAFLLYGQATLRYQRREVFLAGGNVSSFAYILYQVRNSSTFKAFLVGQQ